METPNHPLTTTQSLDIITKMIQEAKGNVTKNSIYLLLWGFVTIAANVGMFVLMNAAYPQPFLVWFITIPAWIATIIIAFKSSRSSRTTSHLDRINACLWFSYGVAVFGIVAFGYKINFQLNPIILIMSSVPAFVSGIIIRFRPLIVGGILFWIFGIACFLVVGPWQYLVGAIAVLVGYVVPGVMLRNKNWNNV